MGVSPLLYTSYKARAMPAFKKQSQAIDNYEFKNKKDSFKEPFKKCSGVFLPPATSAYLPQAAIINVG